VAVLLVVVPQVRQIVDAGAVLAEDPNQSAGLRLPDPVAKEGFPQPVHVGDLRADLHAILKDNSVVPQVLLIVPGASLGIEVVILVRGVDDLDEVRGVGRNLHLTSCK